MNLYLIVTLLSLLFFSFTSQVFLIWPWHGRVLSFDLLRLLVPFNFFIGMFLWNFYLAAKTDPGWVLEDWHKGFVTDGQEKDLKGRLRYCYICNKYKPPRTHHCSICQRCVLCMDHHCSWLGQCVGYFNHGYQIRTLIYANLTCIYHISMITAHIYVKPVILKRGVIMIGLNYANVIPFFACVVYFSYTQLSPLLRNRTIIENWLEGNLDKELKV
ncbi:hypothetical protein M378DRAFT_807245 [Amanita muscaria Koide BX008]|uniref:Palmitoyltransferase n=1 Tax=Amanita muscaria (strain Koide BX008) TaxID=946122 RepID=A0A0C2X039_AMAMK|nr:hypothetical protein M378DRAFT_807245 [Amanita muscaria Koide BX008]